MVFSLKFRVIALNFIATNTLWIGNHQLDVWLLSISKYPGSLGRAAWILKSGEKYYIYVADNSFLFPTVKKNVKIY